MFKPTKTRYRPYRKGSLFFWRRQSLKLASFVVAPFTKNGVKMCSKKNHRYPQARPGYSPYRKQANNGRAYPYSLDGAGCKAISSKRTLYDPPPTISNTYKLYSLFLSTTYPVILLFCGAGRGYRLTRNTVRY